MEMSNAVVVGLGMGTVFVGLVCLVILCYIMSAVVRAFSKKEATVQAPTAVAATPKSADVKNKGEFAAAIACAIAEDLGTDVTGIRIKSVKKI